MIVGSRSLHLRSSDCRDISNALPGRTESAVKKYYQKRIRVMDNIVQVFEKEASDEEIVVNPQPSLSPEPTQPDPILDSAATLETKDLISDIDVALPERSVIRQEAKIALIETVCYF